MEKIRFSSQTGKDSGYYFYVKDSNILHQHVSQYQDVKIIENQDFGRTLLLDNKVMLCLKEEHEYHELIVHPSCLQLKKHNKALVIGGGDCFTAKTLSQYPFTKIDMVEIDADVVGVCKHYFKEQLGNIFDNPQFQIYYEDAFKFHSDLLYDYIALDLTDPDTDISSSLYSQEALSNIKKMMSRESILAIQCASPFDFANVFQQTIKTLSNFKHVAAYGKYMKMYGTYQYFIYCSDHFDVENPNFQQIKKNIDNLSLNDLKIYSPEYHELLLKEYQIHARIKSLSMSMNS